MCKNFGFPAKNKNDYRDKNKFKGGLKNISDSLLRIKNIFCLTENMCLQGRCFGIIIYLW